MNTFKLVTNTEGATYNALNDEVAVIYRLKTIIITVVVKRVLSSCLAML